MTKEGSSQLLPAFILPQHTHKHTYTHRRFFVSTETAGSSSSSARKSVGGGGGRLSIHPRLCGVLLLALILLLDMLERAFVLVLKRWFGPLLVLACMLVLVRVLALLLVLAFVLVLASDFDCFVGP